MWVLTANSRTIWDQSGTRDTQDQFRDCPGESGTVGSPMYVGRSPAMYTDREAAKIIDVYIRFLIDLGLLVNYSRFGLRPKFASGIRVDPGWMVFRPIYLLRHRPMDRSIGL